MQIRSLNLYRLDIPFRFSFKHHSAERAATESVWVEAVSAAGLRGFGEACPRAYVSGEDLDSVKAFFQTWRGELLQQVNSLASLRAWAAAHRDQIDAQPAAWCALELALLDLLAKTAGESVEALLGLAQVAGEFRYTAVLGDSSPENWQAQVERYLALGFTDFKLKLAGDPARDHTRLAWLHHAGVRIRVDANNLWPGLDEACAYFKALELPLFAIEEPLRPAGQFRVLAELAARLQTRVIVDESCLRLADLAQLRPVGAWIINLRVSKMGGLLRSLAVAEAAHRLGIPLIIGAQVGESSLLTRSALTLAQSCRAQLTAQEGAFGTHLLCEDILEEPLMFGRAGVLRMPAGQTAGFGLKPRESMPFLTWLH